jgi:ketol-acid reductoisomerase
MISKQGFLAVYESLDEADRETFKRAYSAAYHPMMEIMLEIYDEIVSGNEIRSVIEAAARHKRYPMGKIDRTDMWKIGTAVRAKRAENHVSIDPATAGIYPAGMMSRWICSKNEDTCIQKLPMNPSLKPLTR